MGARERDDAELPSISATFLPRLSFPSPRHPLIPPPLLPVLHHLPYPTLPIVLPVCWVRANIAFHIPSKEQKIVTVPFARALRGKYLTAAVVVPFPAHPASH